MGRSISRRQALQSAAVVGVGPALSACGASATTASDTTTQGTGKPAGTSGTALVKTSEVPVGSGTFVQSASVVVTQPTSGTFKCFSAVCTHQGCLTKDVTDTINCPCHFSKFAITDGSVVSGPAPAPLPEKPITVKGDQITLG